MGSVEPGKANSRFLSSSFTEFLSRTARLLLLRVLS